MSTEYHSTFVSKISRNQSNLHVFNPSFLVITLVFSKYLFHFLHFVIPFHGECKWLQALSKMTITLTYSEDLIFWT